jgi:8-oxo-dGTP diphosphatase
MPQSNNQQFIANATIFNKNGEILLSQRYSPESPTTHLHWQFPGGGIDHGENPDEAVIRELREEIGLSLSPISHRPIIFSHVFKESNTHICLIIYGFSLKAYTTHNNLDKETNDVRWFTLDEIRKLKTLPRTEEIAREAWAVFKDLV